MIPARVFLVVWWFDRLGGMERHVTDLAIALARRRVAVTVFSEQPLARSNQYAQALRAANIPVIAPPRAIDLVARIEHGRVYRFLSGRSRARSTNRVDQHLSQALLLRAMTRHAAVAPPALVHLHGCRLGQQAVLKWATARGCASFYTEHTTISDWGGPFDADAPQVIGRLADGMACVSEHSRTSLLAHLPEPREIEVVRHIVHAPPPEAAPGQRPDRPVRLLAVGRLAAYKGYTTLLTAAASLQADGIDFELRIAGDGEQLGELAALRTALALEARVTFLGRLDQAAVGALWRTTDIGVMPSLTEGLPLAIVEALAQATPIVATRVGGIPEVIRDGENGLLVKPGDAAELTAALRRLITDSALTQRLAEGARQSYAAGGWSEAAVIDHHLALYTKARQHAAARRGVDVRSVVLLAWRMARYGTMESAICDQARALADAGVEVCLLVERPIGLRNPYARQMRRAGVRIIAPSLAASLWHRIVAAIGGHIDANFPNPVIPARLCGLPPAVQSPALIRDQASWARRRKNEAQVQRFAPKNSPGPGQARADERVIGRGRSPLRASFAAACDAQRPDVVHIHGWGLGTGWASLDPILHQAASLGITSVYSEHADAPDCTDPAPCLRSVSALTASSVAAADALEAATGRPVARIGLAALASLGETIALYHQARNAADARS